MAQTRVFSWKIDGNSYGYLYIPPGKTGVELISNRITDDAVLTNPQKYSKINKVN